MKKTTKKFINESKKIHGDRYDYSKVVYVRNNDKVIIVCPKHGEFYKTPVHHLNRNQGCPKCKNIEFGLSQLKTNEEFINESKKIHGDRYNYSKVKYSGNKNKVIIICPKHGEFQQIPDNHIKGKGCKYCGGTAKLDTKIFITKAKKIHGDRYDYSKVKYVDTKTNITIICPKHGEFDILPNNHLSKGQGCLSCLGRVFDTKSFITKAKKIHGNKYDYSKVKYIDLTTEVDIICKTHGLVKETPLYHINNYGCKKCTNSTSIIEMEVIDFIKSIDLNFIKNDRSVLGGKELDIYIPSKKIGIEINGLYWHSEIYKDKKYHLNKTKLCESKGIQLIHLFEDEWVYKKEIVKSRLKNLLGLSKNRIYGRNTIVKLIDSKTSKIFLDNNHIQGNVNSKIKLGLYYDDELISLMTFGKRKIFGNSEWELIRFCNKLDTTVIGGASKLFKYFVKTYKPKSIISYADRRWSSGNLYKNLGFEFKHASLPNYTLFNDVLKIRENRFKYQKHKLLKMGYDSNLTENEITQKLGLYRIYDSGNLKYEIITE